MRKEPPPFSPGWCLTTDNGRELRCLKLLSFPGILQSSLWRIGMASWLLFPESIYLITLQIMGRIGDKCSVLLVSFVWRKGAWRVWSRSFQPACRQLQVLIATTKSFSKTGDCGLSVTPVVVLSRWRLVEWEPVCTYLKKFWISVCIYLWKEERKEEGYVRREKEVSALPSCIMTSHTSLVVFL